MIDRGQRRQSAALCLALGATMRSTAAQDFAAEARVTQGRGVDVIPDMVAATTSREAPSAPGLLHNFDAWSSSRCRAVSRVV